MEVTNSITILIVLQALKKYQSNKLTITNLIKMIIKSSQIVDNKDAFIHRKTCHAIQENYFTTNKPLQACSPLLFFSPYLTTCRVYKEAF